MLRMLLGAMLAAAVFLGSILVTPEPHAKALSVLEKTAVQLNDNCSGTVVDKKKRLVLTAYHCIEGYRKDYYHTIDRVLFNPDGTEKVRYEHLARVARTDSKEDIAILEIVTGVALPAEAVLSETPVKQGDTIYAMGNPFGWEYIFSHGTVIHANFIASSRYFPSLAAGKSYIATDHTSYKGSSGSAIVNAEGEIVGIHTLGNEQGFRWSVPVSKATRLLGFLR